GRDRVLPVHERSPGTHFSMSAVRADGLFDLFSRPAARNARVGFSGCGRGSRLGICALPCFRRSAGCVLNARSRAHSTWSAAVLCGGGTFERKFYPRSFIRGGCDRLFCGHSRRPCCRRVGGKGGAGALASVPPFVSAPARP